MSLRMAEYTVMPEQAKVAAKAGSNSPWSTKKRGCGTLTSLPYPPSWRTPKAQMELHRLS